MPSIELLMRTVVGGVIVTAMAVALSACGADSRDVRSPAHGVGSGAVQRVSVTGSAVTGTTPRREWIDVQSGRWRIEDGGRTRIFRGNEYIVLDDIFGASVRTGSEAFLGYIRSLAVSRDAVEHYVAGKAKAHGISVENADDGKTVLRFRRGGHVFVATIEETLTDTEAGTLGLFTVPSDQEVTTRATEVVPGRRPSLPVQAYWFGNEIEGRQAVTAIEHSSLVTPELLARGLSPKDEARAYLLFYELPSARNQTSAFPGQRAPTGEIQVANQPIDLPAAQGAIDAFNGINGDQRYSAWPRTQVTLANGEPAVVIPDLADGNETMRSSFAVVTDTTLINVIGRFDLTEIPLIAKQLRPVND
jgi:hypothetical protein